MVLEVGDPEGDRFGDQESEHTASGGFVLDTRLLLVAETDGDELLESGACLVEHTQRGIAGTHQHTRLLHEVTEQFLQLEVGGDHEDRRHEPSELLGIVDAGVGHGRIVERPMARQRESGSGAVTMCFVTIRVFLLDDHELVREGIRSVLESDEEIEVVGEASTGQEAVVRVPLAHPDVAILDVRLEEGDGIEVCRELRSASPDLACLMLTSFADDEAMFASVMAGAAGYVLKQIKARDLIDDVKKVAAGASLMDPKAVARVVDRIANPPKADPRLASLSPQEGRILDLIAEGKTNHQIAEAMFLSENTVKNYVTGLLRKLKVTSRTEAAIYATRLKSHG